MAIFMLSTAMALSNGNLQHCQLAMLLMSSSAISSDGTIYAGSGDGNLYAINSDGTLKWWYSNGRFCRVSGYRQ